MNSPLNRSGWDPADGVVEFPDGRRVRGRSSRRLDPAAPRPDYGLYLLATPPRELGWTTCWIPWPDFGLPLSTTRAVAVVQDAFRRAATERVEVACAGGAGRTGTALALMAAMGGVPAEDAVGWIRRHYRATAVETPWQQRWVIRVAGRLAAPSS